MNLPILAASTEFNDEWWKQISPSRNEYGLLLATAGVIAVLALIWAVFIRKRENEGSSRYTYPHVNDGKKDSASNTVGSPRHRRRKRRRHRRNPTLAETGGLPPIRQDELPDDPP